MAVGGPAAHFSLGARFLLGKKKKKKGKSQGKSSAVKPVSAICLRAWDLGLEKSHCNNPLIHGITCKLFNMRKSLDEIPIFKKFVFKIYGSFWRLIFFYPLPSTGLMHGVRLREIRLQQWLALALKELQ